VIEENGREGLEGMDGRGGTKRRAEERKDGKGESETEEK